jgi:tetratricopeptide (TPR) repeat protein
VARSRSAISSSIGGARAAVGLEFQAQVFAWFAAKAIAGISPDLGLGDEIRITGVGSETGLPLDDVGVSLSSGGFVLVQAKGGMRRLARDAFDLGQAVDQVVAALLGGIRTNAGVRAVDAGRDRLVIATNQAGSQAFDELGKVCMAFPGLPDHLPVKMAATTQAQEQALDTFLAVVRESWSAAVGREPTKAEIRRLLDLLQVMRFDFHKGDGVDLLRATEVLRARPAMPLVDWPFGALVEIGRTRGWHNVEQLRRAIRRRDRSEKSLGACDSLRALPQPYVERSGPGIAELDATKNQAITVISGPAGCGKTTLAVRLARDLADRFPDGQLMIDMRGFAVEAPMSTNEAVDILLHQMGMFGTGKEEPFEARRLRFIKALENGRFVVVLDNVVDSRSVAPLLPRGETSKTIITSRRTLATLTRERGIPQVDVGLLKPAEAESFFSALVGRHRVDAEPEAAGELLAACGNLPLAISIAGSQVTQKPTQRLESIAAGLTATEDRLDFLDLGEPESSIRSILSWSYASLTEEQRRAYLLMGTALGPELDILGAKALLGSDQARGLLQALRQHGLAHENSDGSLAMHDIFRDFASSLVAAGHLPRETVSAAHGRLLQHYARQLEEVNHKADWLKKNLDRVLVAVRHRANGGHEAVVRQIVDSLIEPLWHRGRFDDAESLLRPIVAGFANSTDTVAHAYFLRLLAISLRRAGNPEEGATYAGKALRLLEQGAKSDSGRARADCYYIIGVAMASQNDHESALEHFRSALAGFEDHGTESDIGDVLNGIGWSLAMTGELEQALAQCSRAVVIHARVGPARSLAADLDSLGYIHRLQGDRSAARDHFERCLAIYREIGHRPHEARTLEELGDTAAISGDFSTASLYWTQAVTLLTGLGLETARVREKLKVK